MISVQNLWKSHSSVVWKRPNVIIVKILHYLNLSRTVLLSLFLLLFLFVGLILYFQSTKYVLILLLNMIKIDSFSIQSFNQVEIERCKYYFHERHELEGWCHCVNVPKLMFPRYFLNRNRDYKRNSLKT